MGVRRGSNPNSIYIFHIYIVILFLESHQHTFFFFSVEEEQRGKTTAVMENIFFPFFLWYSILLAVLLEWVAMKMPRWGRAVCCPPPPWPVLLRVSPYSPVSKSSLKSEVKDSSLLSHSAWREEADLYQVLGEFGPIRISRKCSEVNSGSSKGQPLRFQSKRDQENSKRHSIKRKIY